MIIFLKWNHDGTNVACIHSQCRACSNCGMFPLSDHHFPLTWTSSMCIEKRCTFAANINHLEEWTNAVLKTLKIVNNSNIVHLTAEIPIEPVCCDWTKMDVSSNTLNLELRLFHLHFATHHSNHDLMFDIIHHRQTLMHWKRHCLTIFVPQSIASFLIATLNTSTQVCFWLTKSHWSCC